ncbi:amino acid deaminase [Rhodoferax lacus]|uniref:Amino acid deaminase n=1 Tax=Rhodoferax lacus TaxID=2184758 RepID=A0A3E1RB35_9BURK|nr:amino acid deaminase [Rhodoferax lacus]RFO96569.1 amino acid deaminase [Rhodoferax lacus]
MLFDASCKSFPQTAAPLRPADIPAQGWQLLADDLAYPLAVLKRAALQHNLAWMQAYAKRRGVHLAPHGKTTMSPELFRMQLSAGAWGISFATVFQLGVGVQAGVRRSIIANQVLSPADLAGLCALLHTHADLQVWFLVDSLEQLRLIEAWSVTQPAHKPFDVLLEIGVAAKRTGVRSQEQALALAQAIAQSPAVRLGGVECYEGNAAIGEPSHDVVAVTELVRRVLEVTRLCDAQALFAKEEILLSAGGSAVFDLVLPLLTTSGLSKPVAGVLRSGCYITHDHGHYKRYLQLVEQREGLTESLQPALEVWTQVQSVPEPGLAFLSCGRRDISFDIELPMPQRLARSGVRRMEDTVAAPPDWRITQLNDQHAYLQFDPAGVVPAVGDRVVLGLSHPCTTFDKWRWMVVAEDDGRVVGAIHTCF